MHLERYMKRFKCRDTGKDCDWKIEAKNEDEVMNGVIYHGQQKHGTKDFSEDVRQGLRAKIRDVESPQIRGDKT
jgi:predicted small metal-binding protein